MKKIFTFFAALVCMMCVQAQTIEVAPNGDVCTVTVDGTAYENLSVTTEGDIHLVAINRDGISLLVRYTDANTVSAIGTVNGQPVDYASAAVVAYAKGFQIPNSDFEEWSSSSSITEPRYWHGFKSAKGDLASQATSTLLKSSDVRSGVTGSSAVIASKSIFGVVANGTITNGQLMAQSMTAGNTWNHSEMDQSSSATDKYGDKFFTSLKAKPDAIKTWLKFNQGTSNSDYPYATMSAVLFNGNYYQDPEPKKGDSSKFIGGITYTQEDVDSVAARVAAKAQNRQISTGDWREFTIPFTYTDTSKAKAILVTISTNATPGKGSANDQVWVDDMELVYNAAISDIALNGVTLDGFNFNAATKTYDLTYSGEVINLTADNFVVTTTGMSAMVVKNVEDLGCGNYRIAIGVTSPDFKNGEVYTINVTKRPVWILGEVNDKVWAANDGLQMDTEDGITYTAEVTFDGRNEGEVNYFSFTTELANDNDEGAWNYIAPFRFGAVSEGNFWVSDEQLDKPLSLTYENGQAFCISKGEYTLQVNLAEMTLVITKVQEETLGDVTGDGKVDVQDLNAVINIMLGKKTQADYPGRANIAGNDEKVDVQDLNAVVNIMLGKS